MYDKINQILQNRWTLPVAGVGVGFAVGFAAGCYARRPLLEEPEEAVQLTMDFDNPIGVAESVFDEMTTIEPTIWPEAFPYKNPPPHIYLYDEEEAEEILAEVELEDAIAEMEAENEALNSTEAIVENVFGRDKNSDWDYEVERERRSADSPYIISAEEFYNEEFGFNQVVVTYYSADDILADEQDVPIYNHGKIVGDLEFGHGSGDANVVYVRNEKLKTEYEILRSSSSFAIEVLGHDIEDAYEATDLKHSATRRFPKIDPG